jgi:hypothetical protein
LKFGTRVLSLCRDMATKAQQFRHEVERSGPGRPPSAPRPRRDEPVDTAMPGVSATDRKAGGGSTATRNQSRRAGQKAGFALENSATGKASRKSGRKSANSIKSDTNLRAKAVREARSPKARASAAKAKKR